jgi:hypothetical protein
MTTVPLPGVLRIDSDPPASSVRSRIDASPTLPVRRNSRAAVGSNPHPLSETETSSVPVVTSTRTVTRVAPECLLTFERASWTTR